MTGATEKHWEGWGDPMWWSNLDQNTNLKMLLDAGFVVESEKIVRNGSERWLWVLARKSSERIKR